MNADDLKKDTNIRFTTDENGNQYINVDDLVIYATRLSVNVFQRLGERANAACAMLDMFIEKIQEIANEVKNKGI